MEVGFKVSLNVFVFSFLFFYASSNGWNAVSQCVDAERTLAESMCGDSLGTVGQLQSQGTLVHVHARTHTGLTLSQCHFDIYSLTKRCSLRTMRHASGGQLFFCFVF